MLLQWEKKNACGISRGCFISMVPPNNSREQTEAEGCQVTVSFDGFPQALPSTREETEAALGEPLAL